MDKFDAPFVLKILETHLAELEALPADHDNGNTSWKIVRVKAQIGVMKCPAPTGYDLLSKAGGEWLGNVREWIKCKAINGCDVTWGSQTDVLRFSSPLTVYDVETIAAKAASAMQAEIFKGATKRG